MNSRSFCRATAARAPALLHSPVSPSPGGSGKKTEQTKCLPRQMLRAVREVALELQLQRELNLARRTKISRRETRVSNHPEIRAPRHERKIGIAEVRLVEDIEHLGAELQVESLREFRVLHH